MYSRHDFKTWLFKEFYATTNHSSDKIIKDINKLLSSPEAEELFDEWRVNFAAKFYQGLEVLKRHKR